MCGGGEKGKTVREEDGESELKLFMGKTETKGENGRMERKLGRHGKERWS